MGMLGQSSFRRILLSRILLFSIPILLLGVAVTFRKARTSLLYTARQNLTESAIRKADVISASIHALQTSLAIASESADLKTGSSEARRIYLEQLASRLPTDVNCLQLVDLATEQLVVSTCDSEPIAALPASFWPPYQDLSDPKRLRLHRLSPDLSQSVDGSNLQSQLGIAITTPIYDQVGELRYSLTARSTIRQRENAEPWSLLGYTVVIDQNGIFLSHPFRDRVGRNINEERDAARFRDILKNVLRDESTVRHLFHFGSSGEEWLAGFSPLSVPITATEQQTWGILAVTPLNSALKGLEAITQILVILTTGLLAAHLLAMLYTARDLALPLEQLGKYARRIHQLSPLERAPKNFTIREVNQLAEVLDDMVKRLEDRARELETAWQEAETANKLKGEFLANTSHELRTPLNAIIGCIRLVQDDCCDSRDEEVEFLRQADKAAVHLLKIINDLLDIRRIEEEGIPLYLEIIDVRQILKEVLDLQSVQIQQKGLELRVIQPTVPVMIKVDAARLKQVLLNVVYNATKFTDHGSITVQTQVEMIPALQHFTPLAGNASENLEVPPLGWVLISVLDTGIGIDPAQQHKLFRPFVMVDGTTTRKFEGTGLGLAISRNLIEMMGGSISLQSDGLDQGTRVEIRIPLVESLMVEDAVDNLAAASQPQQMVAIVSSGSDHVKADSLT